MNRRLQQFLAAENLTPARLSDIMGIQRSGLSHILAGRNNPSYEFISTLLLKFPNLNADWLLLGKGKMYKDYSVLGESEPEAASVPPAAEPDLFNGNQDYDRNENLPGNIKDDLPDDLPVDTPEETLSPVPASETGVNAGKKSADPRNIVRITVFYADGHYEER